MEQMKKDNRLYDDQATKLMRQFGLEQPDEEEEDRFLLGGSGYEATGRSPADRQVYHMPPSVRSGQDRQNFMPYLGGNREMRPRQMPYFGDGKNAMINLSYTAADGTMYQIGVVSPKESRGKALYNVLAGLYAVMSAEGKGGQYANVSKGGK